MHRTTVIHVILLAGLFLATVSVGGVHAVNEISSVATASKPTPCAVVPRERYWVEGTLVSLTADDPATGAFEGSVTVTVSDANRHARDSGEIADQDATAPGVQVVGATYTVSGDAYVLTLKRYEGADTPSVGDAVRIAGDIPLTDADCAPAGTTLADRYGSPNVVEVTVTDSDPDA